MDTIKRELKYIDGIKKSIKLLSKIKNDQNEYNIPKYQMMLNEGQ